MFRQAYSIKFIHTYARPDVDDLHTDGGVLGILVAVPVLPAPVDLAAVRTFNHVPRPYVVQVTGPGIVGRSLITRFHHYFVSIFITDLK